MPLYGDAKREYDRKWIANRRAEWLRGKVCEWCGTTENLEIDHTDPDTKEIRVSSLWGMAPDNPKRIAELAKCQVLCSHHHDVKSALELSLKGTCVSRPVRTHKYVS